MVSEDSPEQMVAFAAQTATACREVALALEAAGLPYHTVRTENGFVLLVPAHLAESARVEIEAWAQERRSDAPSPSTPARRTGAWIGVAGYAAVIIAVAALTDRNALGVQWVIRGSSDAELVRHGEWWRTITALTLHSGAAHLAGNLFIGSLFGLYCGRMLGPGFGWYCILLGGTAGNFINAVVRPTAHSSIGASTAVFAALGLLAALGLRGKNRAGDSILARLAPFIGALVLLAFLGTGSERTDVGAHAAGFISGLLLGHLVGKSDSLMNIRTRGQLLFGLISIGSVVASWLMALRN